MRRNTLFTTAAAAALLAPGAVMAQVDTSDWNCEFCPFEDGYRADYSAGGSYVNDDAARFGNGTGLDEKGAYADLDGNGRSLSEGGTEVTWYAEDLGLDSRVFEFGVGKPGKFGLEFGYSELPYRRFGDTVTPFSGSSNLLSLPAGWVDAPTTGGMTALPSALASVPIATDRTSYDFGADIRAARNFRFYADYRRQEREGTGIMAGSFFTQASYLPRPIDDYTDRFDVGVAYAGDSFTFNLGYFGSYYRNELDSLAWDNPFTSFAGADMGQLAVEPDNDFHQVSFSAAYFASTWNTVIALSAAQGKGEQNASLLPYTINPTIPAPAILLGDIDGKVDTTNYALTLTTRPLDKLNVKLAYRYDERDNGTPVNTWTRVITDAVDSGDIETNIPYSFERSRLSLSGTYRLLDTVTISGGWDRSEIDRDFQEVASQDEDTGWGKLRWRPTAYLEATFKGGGSRREIDDYDTDVGLTFGQNPLMRKYNLAHRARDFAEVALSASLIDTPISIGMTYLWAEDDYSKSELGMIEGSEDRFTVDFNWAVGESSTVYLTAGSEALESLQRGSETFAGPEWEASHDDDFTHYGGGFRIAGIGEKVDLTFDYTRSDGETEILVTGPVVAAAPLPELESTMDSLRLAFNYNVSERLAIDVNARWERFEAEDWGIEGVAPDTISSVLTMGANPYDYDVWVFGIGFRYSVGADPEE
ncbi:MAG: MtrB/PioB family decaheme-associated outer membrane protein [Woeseiaceae bacterium]|nr:MtrB/PioB family decaheme-associated outer membrane protein [Woeseiaceae bacterium]